MWQACLPKIISWQPWTKWKVINRRRSSAFNGCLNHGTTVVVPVSHDMGNQENDNRRVGNTTLPLNNWQWRSLSHNDGIKQSMTVISHYTLRTWSQRISINSKINPVMMLFDIKRCFACKGPSHWSCNHNGRLTTSLNHVDNCSYESRMSTHLFT